MFLPSIVTWNDKLKMDESSKVRGVWRTLQHSEQTKCLRIAAADRARRILFHASHESHADGSPEKKEERK